MKLKVKKLRPEAKLPEKAHSTDAGFDLFALEPAYVSFPEMENRAFAISTGIAIEIPQGYYGRIVGRSGNTLNTPFKVFEGIIDSDYRGEIKVMAEVRREYVRVGETVQSDGLVTKKEIHSKRFSGKCKVFSGAKIAQLIICPLPDFEIEEVEELSDTVRGDGGFGSTGK
uniref:dUTP diphosphatase n=1 Tax=Ndongobacter massiliensis TaxID=1871025 RepID=UPI0009311D01|nr:hypothetical protein [Ndongobacter massiliensis]